MTDYEIICQENNTISDAGVHSPTTQKEVVLRQIVS